MKKLDLTDEIYIVEERIFPDEYKSATYIYPKILNDNSILRNNIDEHTCLLYDEYFDLQNKLAIHKKILDGCLFDSERDISLEIIYKTEYKLIRNKNLIDEGISPFTWNIYKDADMYVPEIGYYVKDDFILILKYKKEEPDE
jgi:hypothetical protein